MTDSIDQNIELLTQAYKLGAESIIDFRKLFLPSPDECESASFHYEWDKILRDGKRHIAIEAFRESGKSVLVIRAHLLYRLVYPSIDCNFIVIIMANQRSASKKLKEIADEYVTNDLLKANLVRIREQSEKAFDCIVTNNNGDEIPVRIEAYGKGAAVRGLVHRDLRPQLIVMDDCQDLEDSISETVTSQDYDWFLSDILFLGQKSRIFMIGNNLGERCLIERIINNCDELEFDVMRIPILDDDGKSSWPDKWPVDGILKQKEQFNKLGKLDVWFREKMCIAISPDNQLFKKENYRYYDPTEFKRDGMCVFTTVDLASSQNSNADYTAIMTIGVNKDNHWFILDCQYGRYDPTTTIDKIFWVVQTYKPIYLGVEKVQYQSVMRHFLEKEMPKRNCFFIVKDLIADKKKELRIESLQPRFVTGTIWFPKNASFLAELESELYSFPRSLHDDLIDALAYFEQISFGPVSEYWTVATEDIPSAGGF